MTRVHVKGYTPWPDALAKKYRANNYWQNEPLDHFLRSHSETTSEKIALIEGNKNVSYEQLNRQANVLAVRLLRLGLNSGDSAVLQLGNSADFFIVFFALLRIGVVPVMALPTHRYAEINHFCHSANAVLYIAPVAAENFNYLSLAKRLLDEKTVSHVLICGDYSDRENRSGESFYGDAVGNFLGEFSFLQHFLNDNLCNQKFNRAVKSLPNIDAQGLALLQLSGGTTNLSKLIPRTHNDYLYSIRASAKICGLTPETVFLAVLPVAHNFTLTSPGALGTLFVGGTVVLSDNGAPDTAFALIARHRVSITAVVPPLAIVWLEYSKNTNAKLSGLNVLQVGGAKLLSTLADQIAPVLGCQLQQVFGMAEGLVNYTRLDDSNELVVNTQGRPICTDDEIRIVDADDNDVPPGEPGHLLTRGPYTIRGYFNASDHNAKAFTSEGFYRTGDIVRQNSLGYLTVVGRDKDQINRGGEKIAAEEIENYLLSHLDIHDVAAVAMPDDFLGEKTCVYVIPVNSNTCTLRLPVVRKYLRDLGVADYKLPDRIEIVNSLPKTKFGKVNKKQLREDIAKKMANVAKKVSSNNQGEHNVYS